jgi:hypothetical protein
MNFLQMKQDLADRLSSFDETVASDNVRLGRWLNRAQDSICTAWAWPFNRQLDIIQTVADYTTGTVDVTSGSTTLTFSSGPLVSMANRFIKFGSLSDWYEIVSHTAGSTTATINPLFQGTTLTGSTFLIRKFRYGLASNALTVLDVKIATNNKNLVSLAPMYADMTVQMNSGTGTPTAYFLTTPAADGSPQIGFYPNAEASCNVYVEEKFQLTEMVLDADTSIIPAPYHDTIVTLASYFGFLKVNSLDRATMVMKEYTAAIEEMKKVYSQDSGRNRIVRATDSSGDDGQGYSLPPHFGPMSFR